MTDEDRVPYGDEVTRDDAALLERLSGELRDEPGPSIDFDAMAPRLLARVEQQARGDARRRWAWGGASVVALSAAAAWLFVAPRAPAPAAPVAAVAPPIASAAVGVRVDGARAFARPGFASWSFDEAASADVDDTPERVTVRLRRGSVRVEVVPGHASERFVVVAAGARVAVHGTVFKVSLAERVRVDVERGVVAVGPVDRPATWTLNAPSGGTFSRDASSGEVGALEPFSPSSVDAASSRPQPARSAPREVTLEPAALRERVRAVAQACFSRRMAGAAAEITFDTRATLTSTARGLTLAFSPPLEPSVEQCVRDGAAGLRAQPGVDELSLSLVGRR
ncbi:MAG: FecR domain-containing protein [Polyangiaceae bacterium]|nr:FecR domain-containing protein [Polyangiaceae bacterium]